MKLLHTADWHLGKRLDHHPRLPEQREVLSEICEIADREAVDAVLIAGDLFDHANPSMEALELFYYTLKKLTREGQRPVIGIAGNHDAPDRLEAPDPLARASGILLAGYPHSQPKPFQLETGVRISKTAPGFVELELPGFSYPLRLLLTPYANGFRMQRFLGTEEESESLRQLLQAHWQQLAEAHCDATGINLLMAHLFFMRKGGPKPEEPDDEKPMLTVGGAQEIFTQNLPSGIQYAALGHLHRYHSVAEAPCPVVYSGSPLAYSFSEADQQKYVVLIEAEPGKAVHYQPIALSKGKQLSRKKFESLEAALTWLKAHPNTLVELSLRTEHFLNAKQRKALHSAHDGIINIIPDLPPELAGAGTAGEQVDLSQSMEALFVDYFKSKNGQAPNQDLLELLKEVLGEEGE
jgi:exonuclease SbcD